MTINVFSSDFCYMPYLKSCFTSRQCPAWHMHLPLQWIHYDADVQQMFDWSVFTNHSLKGRSLSFWGFQMLHLIPCLLPISFSDSKKRCFSPLAIVNLDQQKFWMCVKHLFRHRISHCPNSSCLGVNDGCQAEHTPSRSVARTGCRLSSAWDKAWEKQMFMLHSCLGWVLLIRTHSGSLWYPFSAGLLWFLTDLLWGPAVLHLCWKGQPRSGGNMEKEKCRAWGNTSGKTEVKTPRKLGTIDFQQVGSYILFRHLTESR